MPELKIQTGPQKGQSLLLRPPGPVFIGRDLEADFPVFDRKCSRRHFRIDFLDEGYSLTDLRSRYGTFVNNQRVERRRLASGSRIVAGKTLFVFEYDEPQDELINRDVGGFRVVERMGRGGMGIVYRAVQTSLDRTVALKVLSQRFTAQPEFCTRFVAEARAAGDLAHPNLVRVYDVDWKEGILFYAMEFMAHGSIADMIRVRGPLPVDQVCRIVVQACAGLEYAHRRGVVHRDIKPSNLLVHANGSVKIADLGIASRLHAGEPSGEETSISGSPRYMSPEQVLGRTTDARSDVYSLGVSLFEMLTGAPPFRKESVKDTLFAHISEDPPDVRSLRPSIPPLLATLVRRTLSKTPGNRPQSAAALGDLLRDSSRAAEELASAAARPRGTWGRWARRAVVIVGACLTGVALGAIMGHVGVDVGVQRERVQRVRSLVARGRDALRRGDLKEARAVVERIASQEGSPQEWELLAPEIAALRNALKTAERAAGAPGGGEGKPGPEPRGGLH